MPKRADKIPCQGGDEYDFLGWCKKFFKFRPLQRKRLKRKYNKRLRKEVKHGIKDQMGCVRERCGEVQAGESSYPAHGQDPGKRGYQECRVGNPATAF